MFNNLFEEFEDIQEEDSEEVVLAPVEEVVEEEVKPEAGSIHIRTRYKIIGSDFSAQEPRLTAFMSQDPAMLKAYEDGLDLYCVIAASMFDNNYEDNLEFYPEGKEIEVDGKKVICGKKTHLHKAGKERRSAAKTLLLAMLYGMSVNTAAARMGKSKDEGQKLFDNFFASFPKVKQLIEDSKQYLKEHGYVEDWAGRRRHLDDYFLPRYEARYKDPQKLESVTFNPILECENRPEVDRTLTEYVEKAEHGGNKKFDTLAVEAASKGIILSANTGRIAQAERQCLNARIQGGAASLTKLAMVNVFNDQLLRDCMAKLIITVHDEVLCECPEFYADTVEQRLPKVMIDTAKPFINVGMKCDPYNVTRWYADEYGVAIQEEFKKLESKGLTRDAAIEKLCASHIELPREAIINTVTTGSDLDF